jgi:hypothetical protein
MTLQGIFFLNIVSLFLVREVTLKKRQFYHENLVKVSCFAVYLLPVDNLLNYIGTLGKAGMYPLYPSCCFWSGQMPIKKRVEKIFFPEKYRISRKLASKIVSK